MFDARKASFLNSVLGLDGARALIKAAERFDVLSNALVPRAILSWLQVSKAYEYEGGVPGVDNTYLAFKKNEQGFSGAISLGDDVYTFSKASHFHLAAAIGVAIGCDGQPLNAKLRDLDVQRLGKSIDTLVKAKVVTENMAEALKKKPEDDEEVEKVEEPGQTAKPKEALGPIPPAGPQAVQTAPKASKPKLPGMNITKSEAAKPCKMCGDAQFQGADFVGCLCLSDLKKNVKATPTDTGYVLQFKGLNSDDVEILMQAMRGDNE